MQPRRTSGSKNPSGGSGGQHNSSYHQSTLGAVPAEEPAYGNVSTSRAYWPPPPQYTDPNAFKYLGIGTQQFTGDEYDKLSRLVTLVDRVYVPQASLDTAATQPPIAAQLPGTSRSTPPAVPTETNTPHNGRTFPSDHSAISGTRK